MSIEQTLEIKFQFFDDDRLPEDEKWLAWIEGKKGFVVTGKSMSHCVIELGKSLRCMEIYEQIKKDDLSNTIQPNGT